MSSMGHGSALAAVAALLLLLAVVANGSAGAGATAVPSEEELRQKSMKELKAILRKKGAKCQKCVEKDDIVARVVETWDWAPFEAQSPDGKIKMTKDVFLNFLKSSYRKRASEKHESEGGHQLDEDDSGDDEPSSDGEDLGDLPSGPEIELIWADFSSKLERGEIETDEKGHIIYELAPPGGNAAPSLWDKYKTQVMVTVNVGLLWFMQSVRKKERAERQKQEEEKKRRAEEALLNQSTKQEEKTSGSKKKGKDKAA